VKITFEDVRNRKSVRTFEDKVIPAEIKEKLISFIKENNNGPFGNKIRFELIDLTGAGAEELKQLASYGNIRGPKYFMAGAVKKTAEAVLDYGYLMEGNILAAQSLGIGTVWVGGTFSRAGFIHKLGAGPDEFVPAVVPAGYGAKVRDISDTGTRLFVGADTRRPWKEIFFDGSHDKHLAEAAAGKYKTSLEALRLSPSASNKQPWRVIKEGEKFHLFLERTPGYKSAEKADMQLMDTGIAMCNFDVAANEEGLNGKWKAGGDFAGKEGWEYIACRQQENKCH
jgi:nitroreductase